MNESIAMHANPKTSPSIWQAARQQKAFRQLMQAFAYPGRTLPLAEVGEDTTLLLLATLVDGGCRLADPQQQLNQDDLQRLGVTRSASDAADYLLCQGTRPLEAEPRLGTLENPEQGATIVLQVASLAQGSSLTLSGPGIRDRHHLQVSGVDPDWWIRREAWNAHFPLGVDMILVSEEAVIALPRTTTLRYTKGAR
ncbi:MAG: phosphonate C-P lyase system protein PhnH [Chromatiales bacterium]|nr:phosphonate C-P lyase system protein PhnH [Gammaproteobacteria bacterium]MBW6477148.1 phosphonate C-P lyase system protein PhnH [Chromatiales bacterium]